jgi:hypothetical protein
METRSRPRETATRVFGLRLGADRALPAFGDLTGEAVVDVHLSLGHGRSLGAMATGSETLYRSRFVGANGRPGLEVLRMPSGDIQLQYEDFTTFVLAADTSRVEAFWPETSTLEDTVCYLSPVLGIVLRLRGVTCLHASAVALGGAAIAVAGAAGMGKSTTAAALARRGIPVLTDDLLALTVRDHTFLVEPGLPRVQLWGESVEALWGSPDALPRIVPTWGKRYLELGGDSYRHCQDARRLGAVYVLARDPAVSAPAIVPLAGTQAVVALVAHTFANYLLTPSMRAAELAVLARLTSDVAIRQVTAPDDRSRIGEVCDAILDDFDRLTH